MGRDIAMVTAAGELKMQKGSQIQFPNGAVVTPDGKTYIVAESFGYTIQASFEIKKPLPYACTEDLLEDARGLPCLPFFEGGRSNMSATSR